MLLLLLLLIPKRRWHLPPLPPCRLLIRMLLWLLRLLLHLLRRLCTARYAKNAVSKQGEPLFLGTSP